jgi:hypothetical protein
MAATFSSHDWRDRKVREWLLLLLRFAVTREPSDQSAALAAADELFLGSAVAAGGTDLLSQDEQRGLCGHSRGQRPTHLWRHPKACRKHRRSSAATSFSSGRRPSNDIRTAAARYERQTAKGPGFVERTAKKKMSRNTAFMKSPASLYEIPMPQACLPSRFFMAFRPSLA